MVGQSDWLPMMITTGLLMRAYRVAMFGREGADLSESTPALQADTPR
jgi:hypothetical protein